MKNSEKYRTADERAHAFDNFCNGKTPCDKCKLNNSATKRLECAYAWLDLEVEAEMPMPCPFCGDRDIGSRVTPEGVSLICICGYSSGKYHTIKEAIVAHNRICRAVNAANKESEVK